MRYLLLSLMFLFVSCSDSVSPNIQAPDGKGVTGRWMGEHGIMRLYLEGNTVSVDRLSTGDIRPKQSVVKINGESVWFSAKNPFLTDPNDLLTFSGKYNGTEIVGQYMVSYENIWYPITLHRQ